MIQLPFSKIPSKGSNAYNFLCAVAGLQLLGTAMAQSMVLSQQGQKYTTIVPQNFSLSFDLTPTGIVSSSSSIIHYSGDGSNSGPSGRIPAIWFAPGTTKLLVRVATSNDANEGITSSVRSLPLKAKTSVRVEAVGKEVRLFLNNTLDSRVSVSADRLYGKATAYVSDPWVTPAKASIASINLSSINSFTSVPVSDVNGPLTSGAAFEKTTVPQNFSLSFDLTPTEIIGSHQSIIQYSGDGSRFSRMPAIFFLPWTTQLQVFVATSNDNTNLGIYSSKNALPLNAKTSVRIEAVGRDVLLFLNNSLDSVGTVFADRLSGAATVYVSSPWETPAVASIFSINLSSINSFTTFSTSAFNLNLIDGLIIYNSIYDDCSVAFGADAGCGTNLQCKKLSIGYRCVPNGYNEAIMGSGVGVAGISALNQTCGISTLNKNVCSVTSSAEPLGCTAVPAYVNGLISTKSICLPWSSYNSPKLAKRAVRAAYYSFGNTKGI